MTGVHPTMLARTSADVMKNRVNDNSSSTGQAGLDSPNPPVDIRVGADQTRQVHDRQASSRRSSWVPPQGSGDRHLAEEGAASQLGPQGSSSPGASQAGQHGADATTKSPGPLLIPPNNLKPEHTQALNKFVGLFTPDQNGIATLNLEALLEPGDTFNNLFGDGAPAFADLKASLLANPQFSNMLNTTTINLVLPSVSNNNPEYVGKQGAVLEQTAKLLGILIAKRGGPTTVHVYPPKNSAIPSAQVTDREEIERAGVQLKNTQLIVENLENSTRSAHAPAGSSSAHAAPPAPEITVDLRSLGGSLKKAIDRQQSANSQEACSVAWFKRTIANLMKYATTVTLPLSQDDAEHIYDEHKTSEALPGIDSMVDDGSHVVFNFKTTKVTAPSLKPDPAPSNQPVPKDQGQQNQAALPGTSPRNEQGGTTAGEHPPHRHNAAQRYLQEESRGRRTHLTGIQGLAGDESDDDTSLIDGTK